MTERNTLQEWFAAFIEDVKEQPENAYRVPHFEKLWTSFFAQTLGAYEPYELREDTVIDVWRDLEASNPSRADAFSAFLLLRSVFDKISEQTGGVMPDLEAIAPLFSSDDSLTEEGTYLLDDAVLSDDGAAAVAFWLVLHTPLHFDLVLQLRRESFLLEDNTLTLRYDPVVRSHGVSRPLDKCEKLTVPVDARSRAFLSRFIDNPHVSETPFETVTRRILTAKLSTYVKTAGLPAISLSDVDSCVRIVCAVGNTLQAKPTERMTALTEDLELYMQSLPKPFMDHARRCRYLASFFTEYLAPDDAFLELGLEENDLLFATYFHDVGKSALHMDDYYPGRAGEIDHNTRYESHVEKGVEILREVLGKEPSEFPADSTEGILYGAIADHHERPDGGGFPAGKINAHFAGRLCYLVDTLDHMLFIDTPDITPEEAVDSISAQAEFFDGKLVEILTEHKAAFVEFIEEVRDFDGKKQAADAFGFHFEFRPLADSATREPAAYEAHLMLNDHYYGLIDGDKILPLVEEHPNFPLFTRLELKHVLRLILEAREHGKRLPPLLLRMSTAVLDDDKFFSELLRLIIRYNTHYRQIIFVMDERELVMNEVDIAEVAEEFHVMGAGFALSSFGVMDASIDNLKTVHPDAIIFDRSFATAAMDSEKAEYLESAKAAADAEGIKTFVLGADTEESFGTLATLGVTAIGGYAAGLDVDENEWKTW